MQLFAPLLDTYMRLSNSAEAIDCNDYAFVERDVLTSGIESEADIISSILNPSAVASEIENGEENVDINPVILTECMLKNLAEMPTYLLQQRDMPYEVFQKLMDLQRVLSNHKLASAKQSTIASYFIPFEK